jgi:hypothetical protein
VTAGNPSSTSETARTNWALVHRGDILELCVLALTARAGATYLGVGPVTPTARQVAEALAESYGRPGEIASITIDRVRAAMGAIADGFALDQQFTNEKASRQLGWSSRLGQPTGRDLTAGNPGWDEPIAGPVRAAPPKCAKGQAASRPRGLDAECFGRGHQGGG